jgi:hypothetical protein
MIGSLVVVIIMVTPFHQIGLVAKQGNFTAPPQRRC